jgi:serine/threonine protein kinase
MPRYGRWETVRELGSGGQGEVYLVKDTEKTGGTERRLEEIKTLITKLGAMQTIETQRQMADLLVNAISHLTPTQLDPSALGALKLLHKPSHQGYEKAKERMKREVEALSQINHPNILKILDPNIEEGWFVGELHSMGTLSTHQSVFKGDMLAALLAFRPLVEGVSELHRVNMVHRDIKPQNVFFSTGNALVLGDLGIVFFSDSSRTRVTDSYENVGSKDWMPQWAMGMRIEDIKPSFDVFCLGKLLWAIVSGRTFLRLWYHHKDEFELEKMFPKDESIRWARAILDKCVVENEEDCLKNAGELLVLVDTVMPAVKRHAQVIGEGIERRCEVCGVGDYGLIVNEDITQVRNFGLDPAGTGAFKIFSCSHCGHVQIFHISDPRSKPGAWIRHDS